MAVSKGFIDYLLEVLEPLGAVRSNRMFGGAGIYIDELIIAIVVDDEIYFKVDDECRPKFEAEGLEPFIFTKKDGTKGAMGYYHAPEGAIDDPDVMREWAQEGLGAALRAPKKKKKNKK